MNSQTTNTILMVRPYAFGYNCQTAINNHYQNENSKLSFEEINANAQLEFDNFVELLSSKGINVIVFQDDNIHDTPDSIFPNNWVSFHCNGDIALYPMFAPNRRLERREDVLNFIESKGFIINNIVDYSSAESSGLFLEGTGSIVLDRTNRKAYCAISERSDEDLLIEFCEDFEYIPVIFNAFQSVNNERKLIYHTNVMMCVANDFAIVCLDSVDDISQKKNLVNHLKNDGKHIIEISENQVNCFAGNMLQVIDNCGSLMLVMSSSAFNSLTTSQIKSINKFAEIIHSPLDCIETLGGGSARCMMAEVFLPNLS
ncbi:MAG: arginine deiminase-related protein [Flavobacteriaceae bacterium]|nr:arginine deiminase-related protein [Flavobacteriaceae bacterium]